MSMHSLLEESGWPLGIFEDPSKKPIIIETVQEFVDALLYGDHMGKIIVLKDGIYKLGLENSIPTEISVVAGKSKTVREFLHSVDEETLKDSNANIKYVNKCSGDEESVNSFPPICRTFPSTNSNVSWLIICRKAWRNDNDP